jgi:hypothetical protein
MANDWTDVGKVNDRWEALARAGFYIDVGTSCQRYVEYESRWTYVELDQQTRRIVVGAPGSLKQDFLSRVVTKVILAIKDGRPVYYKADVSVLQVTPKAGGPLDFVLVGQSLW